MAAHGESDNETSIEAPSTKPKRPAFVFSKEMMDMLRMLPTGYDLSKIPAEVSDKGVTRVYLLWKSSNLEQSNPPLP